MDEQLKQPMIELLLSLADDKLLLGHRNSDWTGLAPLLEEDIAFSSLAQDELAHAQALYEYIGALAGDNADRLAFGRSAAQFRSAHLVEVPDEFDWATAIARRFFCDHFDMLRLQRLANSCESKLAALARRLVAEEQVHVEHADGWIVRLGQGTAESRSRMQAAIDALSPLAAGLFEPTEGVQQLAEAGLYPGSESRMFESWHTGIQKILQQAGLSASITLAPRATPAGRRGKHTEHLAPMLDEMCEVYRLEPGAAW